MLHSRGSVNEVVPDVDGESMSLVWDVVAAVLRLSHSVFPVTNDASYTSDPLTSLITFGLLFESADRVEEPEDKSHWSW